MYGFGLLPGQNALRVGTRIHVCVEHNLRKWLTGQDGLTGHENRVAEDTNTTTRDAVIRRKVRAGLVIVTAGVGPEWQV